MVGLGARAGALVVLVAGGTVRSDLINVSTMAGLEQYLSQKQGRTWEHGRFVLLFPLDSRLLVLPISDDQTWL